MKPPAGWPPGPVALAPPDAERIEAALRAVHYRQRRRAVTVATVATALAVLAVLTMAQPWHQGSDRVSVATTPPLARSQAISSPSLVVTPARRLLGQQRVLVQLSGFPAYTGVGVSECANTAAVNPKGCSVPRDSYLHLATDAAGNATGTLLVTRKAYGRLGLPPAVLCATGCVLMASTGPNVHPMTTWAPLEFLAGRPHGTGQGGGR